MKFLLMKNSVIFVLLSVCCAVLALSGYTGQAAYAEASTARSAQKEIHYGVKSTSVQTKALVIETVNYSSIQTEEDYINPYFPEYYNTNTNLTNACAPVAGSMIIGFYDRYYTDLITGISPGRTIGGVYRYNPMTTNTSYIQGVIDSLYVSMSTNYPSPGTTQTQYKTGLTSYVTSKSLSITYTSIVSGGAINYESGSASLVSQLAAGNPISLFVSDYNISILSDNGSGMTITKSTYDGNHILVGYGYKKIEYYDSSNYNFRTDLFIKVSSGLSAPLNGWFMVGSSETTLNDAESASIY